MDNGPTRTSAEQKDQNGAHMREKKKTGERTLDGALDEKEDGLIDTRATSSNGDLGGVGPWGMNGGDVKGICARLPCGSVVREHETRGTMKERREAKRAGRNVIRTRRSFLWTQDEKRPEAVSNVKHEAVLMKKEKGQHGRTS